MDKYKQFALESAETLLRVMTTPIGELGDEPAIRVLHPDAAKTILTAAIELAFTLGRSDKNRL